VRPVRPGEIWVDGHGPVAIEARYLPAVVACEHGNASFEALKAQAVAARSYLHYERDRTGVILDSTRHQVFGCDRPVTALHRAAVEQTRGQVLQHEGQLVIGFFVAGARRSWPRCDPADDPSNTEQYVTINDGRRGAAVRTTSLARARDRHGVNRGALSQHAADCLARRGLDYEAILRFFYGADVALAVLAEPLPVGARVVSR
jgi:stage II sporulation protein D